MPDTFLFDLFRVRCDLLEKAVAAWRKDPASIVRGDLDGALHECLGLPAAFRRLHNAIFDYLGDEYPLPDLNALGLAYMALYDRALHILEGVQGNANDFGQRGRLLEDASRLPAVTAEVAALKKEIFDPWPFFTQQDIDEGLAEFARGECVSVEEVLHELQNRHSQSRAS
jgi:hypothetical protein